jgi:hypothetical protein
MWPFALLLHLVLSLTLADVAAFHWCRWSPGMVLAPPATNVVITPLASLALAAARDPQVLSQLGLTTQQALGSRKLLSYVFKKYGYDEAAMGIDLLTFENATLSRPAFAAFYGTNIQLAGLFSILTAALRPLAQTGSMHLQETTTAELDQELQRQLAINIYNQLSVTPFTSALRTGDTAAIVNIMRATYDNVCKKFNIVRSVDAIKLNTFFLGVAQVSAAQHHAQAVHTGYAVGVAVVVGVLQDSSCRCCT